MSIKEEIEAMTEEEREVIDGRCWNIINYSRLYFPIWSEDLSPTRRLKNDVYLLMRWVCGVNKD